MTDQTLEPLPCRCGDKMSKALREAWQIFAFEHAKSDNCLLSGYRVTDDDKMRRWNFTMSQPTPQAGELDLEPIRRCDYSGEKGLALALSNINILFLEITRLRSHSSAERIAGRREGLEMAALVARDGCLVPPDGGSPTEDERVMCDSIAATIRALDPTKEKTNENPSPLPVPQVRTELGNHPGPSMVCWMF